MNENIPNNNGNPQNPEKKKSNALPVIIICAVIALFVIFIGTIMIVLVAVGIIGSKNMKNNDNGFSAPYVSEPEIIATEAVPETYPTEPAPETTEAVTAPPVTTAPVTTEASVRIPDNVLNNAVNSALDSLCVDFAPISYVEYSLRDVSGDGIPELFIRAEGNILTKNFVYIFDNNKFTDGGIYGSDIMISAEDKAIQVITSNDGYSEGTTYLFYQFERDYFYLDDEISSNNGKYFHFKNEIDSEEFNRILNAHNNRTWNDLHYTSYVNADLSFASVYAGLPNISKAPADMQFFDGDELKYGKVTTESTELNLRSGPGTDFDIIYELPKDDTVTIFGESKDWYYVMYNKTSPLKYGFVSKKYITVT